MIYKEIDLCAIVLDIPGEDFGVGSLEHHFLQPQGSDDFGGSVGAPGLHILGDSLGLNHDHVGSSVEETPGVANSPFHVAGALSGEFLGAGSPSGTELDTHLWLGFETRLLHFFHQAQPVVSRDRDKAARDFKDVESYLTALFNVAMHGL